MKRTIYLESTPLDEALRVWKERLGREGLGRAFSPEQVRVVESLGRITAGAISARLSSPFYHSAAMDGYAVRFAETFGASETEPVILRMPGQAIPVDTGDPIPDGFNAVIMIEDVNIIRDKKTSAPRVSGEGKGPGHEPSEGSIEITEPATPWQHVRTIGEDIVATELIVPENHRIRPVDIGALLAGGHTDILVRKRPEVAIIPTGDEIVEPGSELVRGNIIEYNSRVLGGLVTEWGANLRRYPIVRDDLDALKAVISDASRAADMVVINAGSSAGSEDFTAQAIREAGEVLIHGVGIKPGKPVILGIVGGKPVLGIPGYPVSAYITFHLFAKPILYAWQGLRMQEPERIRARLSRQLSSALGQEEFVRVKVGVVGEKTIATPVSRGAGVIMSLVRADGMVRIPSLSEGIGAGTEIEVELLRPEHEIRNTIVCIGSHDNALDLLSNSLKKRYPEYSFASAHVGSMGGLMSLKKGEAHVAGTHLLDEETGLYNVPYIERLLVGKRVTLVNLVYRQQGLLVRKGNPKNIRGFEDLVRDDVVYINRQAGAGTRLLTDKHLRERGIEPTRIRGYDREEYTHMGVASAVLSGVADTGLAILAAARALDLDFIPVARERYDIAIASDFMETEMIKALIDIIRNDGEFREAVSNLGGYDLSDMGKVMYEG
ncbi:MAG TPA: molybdopterin biosynthesis protein [Thermodesulfovibrionales bacterium]|nr:molybdopterin biosynthesis protein [Thermodesulfovibrionales bacterium]